jgi:hypothetical protein
MQQWAQEAATLLEDEVRGATDPLRAEINRLQHERDQLTERLQTFETATDEKMRRLSEEIGQSVQQALSRAASVDPIQRISLQIPVSRPIPLRPPSKPPQTPIQPVGRIKVADGVAKPTRKLPRPTIKKHLPVARSVASIGLLMLIGYLVVHAATHIHSADAGGVVAGASTTRPVSITVQSPDQEYPESYVDIPYAQTIWATYTDSDFGVSISYPKNTSDVVHTVGGDNLWFLRKDGYILKISRSDLASGQTLDQWWATNAAEYETTVTASKGSFETQPAWILPAATKSETSGTSYFLQSGTEVYEVWVKDEDPTSADGQRLARMVASLQFTETTQ